MKTERKDIFESVYCIYNEFNAMYMCISVTRWSIFITYLKESKKIKDLQLKGTMGLHEKSSESLLFSVGVIIISEATEKAGWF